MKHLTGLDATFLYMETPETPMHVGGLHILDLPADYKGDFYEDVKAHVAKRMPLVSLFQRKLALMPFELANPVWVDDDDVDLDYHIRRIVLSKPGSMAQLEAYAARLHSSLLDRSRPLWEFYVIEGLETGQVAFYSKVHHAALDGQAGVALANALLDVTPVPREIKRRSVRRRADYQLGVAELAGAAITNVAAQYVKLVRLLPTAVSTIGSVLFPKGEDGKRRRMRLKKGSMLGPKTILNTAITNQRTFGTIALSLKEVKRVAKAFDATLNDVVVAMCAGAIRRYLIDYDDLPKKPLIAAVPFSLREAGNTEMTNQVTMMMCNMATHIANPVERLAAIKASTLAAKNLTGSLKTVIPTDYPSLFAPWLMTGLMSLYGRTKLANKVTPVANLIISNVPGPQVPLYLCGGLIKSWYPVSIPVHGMALNITVQSYQDSLFFGLTACRRAVPDVHDLAQYLGDALKELSRAAPAEAAIAAPAQEVAVQAASAPVAPTAQVAEAPVAKPRKKPASKATTSVAAVEAGAKAPAKPTRKVAAAKLADSQEKVAAVAPRLRRVKAATNDAAIVEAPPVAQKALES